MTNNREEVNFELSDPQADIIESTQPVNLFLAGQGSGKTHEIALISGVLVCNFPNLFGFIAANTHEQLSQSTLAGVFKVWAQMGIKEYDNATKGGSFVVDKRPPNNFKKQTTFRSYHGIISFKNGHVIFIGSLKNYMAHDGKEFNYALLDETKDTKEVAVKEVITGRLRREGLYIDKDGALSDKEGKPFNPLYIFTSPAKVQWINDWFKLDQFEAEIVSNIYSETTYFKKSFDNKFVTISSTYHNKHNLPQTFIENQTLNLSPDLQDMLIYGNPFSKSGGEFYKCFSRQKQVLDKVFPYNPNKALHISFDFNVHPYVTLTIHQYYEEQKTLVQIDELLAKPPRNSTEFLCKLFIEKYHEHKHPLFIYGDASGKNTINAKEVGLNHYVVIKRELSSYNPVMKVGAKNPSVALRGAFINSIFAQNAYGITIAISPNCKASIADLSYVKEDQNGSKLKEKTKNELTGITYEKFGHTSDANDYIYTKLFSHDFGLFTKSYGSKI